MIRITKRRKNQTSNGVPAAANDNLGSKFMKNFMDLANDLRNERVSESSNHSHGKETYLRWFFNNIPLVILNIRTNRIEFQHRKIISLK